MDIFKRLFGRSEFEKIKINEKDIGPLVDAGAVSMSGYEAPRAHGLESSTGWVYACAGAIADEIGKAVIRLYRFDKGEIKEVEEHPALDLIYRANNFTTKFDLLWLTSQYLELTGEAPWYLSSPNDGQDPDQILLLRPDAIKVVPGKNGEVVGGYKYRVGGKEIPLSPEEVAFLRFPDPNRQFRGKGTLQALTLPVAIEASSEEWNYKFFKNSARPDAALSTDQKLTKEQLDRLDKKLRDKYRGNANSHKTLILQKGLKWQPLQLSAKDMDFIEQSRFSRDKIMAVFRVPKTVLGISEDVNRANAEATDYVFAKRTIEPKLIRIEQQLNEFVLPRFKNSDGLFFKFDSPVPEDEVSELAFIRSGLQDGWLTINEAREMEGYDSIGSDGDKIRVPFTTSPIDAEPVDQQNSVVFTENIAQVKSRDRVKMKIKSFKKSLERSLAEEIRKRMLKKKSKRRGKTKDDVKPAHTDKQFEFHNKQLNIADEFEVQFKSKMDAVFKAQLKTTLAKFPKSVKEVNPNGYNLSLASERRRYIASFTESFIKLLVAQSAEAFSFVGQDRQFDPTDGAITSYLSNRAFKFANPVTRETNSLLGKTLAEGVTAGESIPDLRKRIVDVFGQMEKYRSERIARSETIRASNYVTQESWKESGVVSGKEWLTAEDERVCPWCFPLDGKVIDLESDFFGKGDTVLGSDGRKLKLDYEDVEHPPLHVNCRCTLIPVVVEGRDIDGVDDVLNKLIKENVKDE